MHLRRSILVAVTLATCEALSGLVFHASEQGQVKNYPQLLDNERANFSIIVPEDMIIGRSFSGTPAGTFTKSAQVADVTETPAATHISAAKGLAARDVERVVAVELDPASAETVTQDMPGYIPVVVTEVVTVTATVDPYESISPPGLVPSGSYTLPATTPPSETFSGYSYGTFTAQTSHSSSMTADASTLPSIAQDSKPATTTLIKSTTTIIEISSAHTTTSLVSTSGTDGIWSFTPTETSTTPTETADLSVANALPGFGHGNPLISMTFVMSLGAAMIAVMC